MSLLTLGLILTLTTLMTLISGLPSGFPPTTHVQPPQPTTGRNLQGSSCTRSHTLGAYTFNIWLLNITTLEYGDLGSGFYDNVYADCDGMIVWPANPTILTREGDLNGNGDGLVTGWYVWLVVDEGGTYNGCVEQALWQAERQNLTCSVVAPTCHNGVCD